MIADFSGHKCVYFDLKKIYIYNKHNTYNDNNIRIVLITFFKLIAY